MTHPTNLLQSSSRQLLDVPDENRRSAPRASVSYKISLRHGSRRLVGYTTNMSSTGAFVETREEVTPGTPVHLSFTVGEGTAEDAVEVEGRVVRWVSPERAGETGGIPGLGIEFTRFIWGPETLRNAIDQLLAGCRSGRNSSRRCAARVAVGLPIYWGQPDKPAQQGFLTNLSTSGAFFIQTSSNAPEGARLDLWFELPVRGEIRVVRAAASVARVTEGKAGGEASGMGVHFEQSSIDRATLQDFLDGRRSDVAAPAPPPPRQWPRAVRPAGPAPFAAPPPAPTPPTAGHEEVHPAALDRLFIAAIADEEEAERRKRPSVAHPMQEGLLKDEITPDPTTVEWLKVGRLTVKAFGMMLGLLLGTFVSLILLLI